MSSAVPKPNIPSRPRRSSIAQAAQTAATPGDAYDNSETGTEPPPVPSVPPAARQGDTATSNTGSKRLGGVSGNSRDILLTLPEEEKNRMVNTVTWTSPRTGIKHQSKFMRYAIAKLCEELENEFNNGEPFPPPAVSTM